MKKFIYRFVFLFLITNLVKSPICFSNIIITEIFPNPKGMDKDNEYIEIYNSSDMETSLLNWTIKNTKKSYKISSNLIIPPFQHEILEKAELKLSLLNDTDEIAIYSPDGKLNDKVTYPKPIEGQSYSLINIIKEESVKPVFEWMPPTKKEKNPDLYMINGTVIKEPILDKIPYFIIKTKSNQNFKIEINIKNTNYLLIQKLCKINSEIELLLEHVEGNTFSLKRYELIPQEDTKKNSKNDYLYLPKWTYWTIFLCIILCIILLL